MESTYIPKHIINISSYIFDDAPENTKKCIENIVSEYDTLMYDDNHIFGAVAGILTSLIRYDIGFELRSKSTYAKGCDDGYIEIYGFKFSLLIKTSIVLQKE